jgi:pSer/pThr/pTyr-binding forkhead associated (FHA) protein
MDVNLVLLRKDGSTKNFPILSSITVIGRREDCDLCIPLMVVSKRHCQLSIEQNELNIKDLGSSNGTFINGRKIEEAVINPGDHIQIGPVSFAVQINGVPARDSTMFTPTKGITKSDAVSELNAVSNG